MKRGKIAILAAVGVNACLSKCYAADLVSRRIDCLIIVDDAINSADVSKIIAAVCSVAAVEECDIKTAENIARLEQLALAERELPFYLIPPDEYAGILFQDRKHKNFFVPKVIGAEETKPKGSFRLRRDLFY